MFITTTLHHLRAIKAWADAHEGQAELDISSFQLEVKARNRYYRLMPQFLFEKDDRLLHANALLPDSTAFIGWRPYEPLRLSLSTDKLKFKQALRQAGLPTPDHWPSADAAQADFVLKRSTGSFGYALAGPYRKGQSPATPLALADGRAAGALFAEAFVAGQNIKAWFWGSRPVHVQCMPYARIRGDGRQPVEALVKRRLANVGKNWSTYNEREQVVNCLAYQGADLVTVLPEGDSLWLDYRYGRHFTRPSYFESDDNVWTRMPAEQQSQIRAVADWLPAALQDDVTAPVLCTVDGVLDPTGKIWWLEINSNPICPPTAYFAMMASLFGTPTEPPDNAFARHPDKLHPETKLGTTAAFV